MILRKVDSSEPAPREAHSAIVALAAVLFHMPQCSTGCAPGAADLANAGTPLDPYMALSVGGTRDAKRDRKRHKRGSERDEHQRRRRRFLVLCGRCREPAYHYTTYIVPCSFPDASVRARLCVHPCARAAVRHSAPSPTHFPMHSTRLPFSPLVRHILARRPSPSASLPH